ncbi:MAG: hypothetical protein ACLFSI_02510 [Halorhodospira sp.]
MKILGRFPDAAATYAWAEEVAATPQVVSPTGVVMKRLRQRMGFEWGAGEGWTREEAYDWALTILGEVARIEPRVAREALRHVYGPYDEQRMLWLAVQVAKELQEHTSRSYSQLSRLAKVAVQRQRSREQWRKPLPKAWYAHALGIEPASLHEGGWPGLIREAEGLVVRWARSGEQSLAQRVPEPEPA